MSTQYNMKQARPWMLVNLKIICQFHARPVHQNSVNIFWAEIYRGRLFLGSNLVSFNQTLVPYEISKVNFHVKKNSCQYVRRDLINLKISILVEQANKMTFITHRFRISVVSDVGERVWDLASPLHFMLRRSSSVECVSVLHGTSLQCAEKIYIHQYVKPCEENPR